ncbi:protein-containing complex binding, variant 2 [Balamuthia mandrillaris]
MWKRRSRHEEWEDEETDETRPIRLYDLPPELLVLCFSFLDNGRTLQSLSAVCRTWRDLVMDPSLQTRLGFCSPSTAQRFTFKAREQALAGHAGVVFCMTLWPQEDLLLSGSYDGSVRAWDRDGNFVKMIKATGSFVFGVRVWRNIVCEACYDGKLRLWKDDQVVKELSGHRFEDPFFLPFERGRKKKNCYIHFINLLNQTPNSNGLYSVVVWKDKLCTSSFDRTIRLWDPEKGTCLQVFEGHTNNVQAIIGWGDLLWSGSWDCSLRAWDSDGKQVHNLSAGSTIRSLEVWNDRIYSGMATGEIKEWDKEGRLRAVMSGHKGEVHCLKAWNGLLISGDWKGYLRAWDCTGRCVAETQAHTNVVTSLEVWNNALYTASYDKLIKVWDWGLIEEELLYDSGTRQSIEYSISRHPLPKDITKTKKVEKAKEEKQRDVKEEASVAETSDKRCLLS